MGFGVQVSWLLDNNIVLNWTIPKVHYFNVVQNFALNSLNLGLFDKNVYNATLNAKLGIIIEK